MGMQNFKHLIAVFSVALLALPALAQPGSYQLLDGIVGVVGDEIILDSDVRERVIQEEMQGRRLSPADKCQLFEDMLFEKLLLHHARVDSIEGNKKLQKSQNEN